MPTDRENLKSLQSGELVSSVLGNNATSAVSASHQRTIPFTLNDAATIGTVVTEMGVRLQRRGKVVAAYVLPAIGVAFNATNFATVDVLKSTAGGASTVIATINTSAVSWVAKTPITLAITAANQQLEAGDSLTIRVVKSGTGVAITSATGLCMASVDVEEN